MYISANTLRSLALSALSFGKALAESYEYEHEYVEDGIVEDLTFGAHGNVWAKDHRHIAGWSLSGEGYTPELLSDRIILTPPYPGNKRGGIWAQHMETHDEWEAQFEFRASGPERGSGNLQMWFVKDPQKDVGLASIYTVGKFDGLVLTIGQYQGRGSLRAFLNDGTMSFKDHHHVDQLSFASCDFSYRNLGRFAQILVKQTPWTFEVEIDHVPCFKTHKIHLPHGYYFGLTAASAENPDSFETKSFIVHKIVEGKKIVSAGHGKHPDHEPEYKVHHDDHNEWAHQVQDHYKEAETGHHDEGVSTEHGYTDQHGWYWTSESERPKDEPASKFKSDAERFEDLHTRIATIGHSLDILFHDLSTFKAQSEDRHLDVKHTLEQQMQILHRVEDMVGKVHRNDAEHHDFKEHLEELHGAIQDSHAAIHSIPLTMHGLVKESSPRLGFFLFIILAFQCMLLASYVIYKRRKNRQPKKYL